MVKEKVSVRCVCDDYDVVNLVCREMMCEVCEVEDSKRLQKEKIKEYIKK